MRGAGYRTSLGTAAAALAGLAGLTAAAQPVAWEQIPHMQLERQFAGPLRDTIIQRWRDPIDGTVCYIYLPITAAHAPPAQGGYVQYGANTIGSVSCVLPPAASPPVTATAPPPPLPRNTPPAAEAGSRGSTQAPGSALPLAPSEETKSGSRPSFLEKWWPSR